MGVVTDPAILAQLNGGATRVAPTGGPVMGAPPRPAPAPAPPTPFQQEDQEWKRRDNERKEAKFKAGFNPDGTEKINGGKPTEAQAKIATLLTRIAGGFNDIQTVTKRNPSAQEPGLIESVRGDLAPSGFMGPITRGIAGSDRRTVHDSQRDVLDALLTLSTGAAYNAEQLAGQTASYFPQYNDTQDEINVKNQRMVRLIASAKANAGPAWGPVESAIAPYMAGLTQEDDTPLAVNPAPPSAMPPAGGPPADGDGEGPLIGTVHGNASDFDANGNYIGSNYIDDNGDEQIVGELTPGSQAARKAKLEAIIKARGVDTSSAGDAAYDHVVQGATLGLSDELSGVGGAIAALFRNKPVIDGYRDSRDATRLQLEQEKAASPYASGLSEFGGGMLLPVKGVSGVNSLAGVAKTGGKIGGVAGYGYGEGAGGSTANALIGAAGGAVAAPAVTKLAGAVAPYAGKVTNALAGRGKVQATQEAADMAAAGARQQVPVRRADVDPSVRGKISGLEKTDRGGPIIRDAVAQDAAAIEDGVARVGGAGNAGDRFAAGQIARDALERHGVRTKDAATIRYRRAEQLSGDPAIEPTQAITRVAEAVAKLEGAGTNSNSAEIKFLRGLGEDLSAPGGKNISQLRDLRSNIRTQLKASKLDNTPAEARVLDIMKSFSADIERGLVGNKPALDAYKLGDKIWRERAEFRKQITSRLLGPKDRPHSAEATASGVESMMKNDSARFKEVIAEFSPTERADFNATVAANLGRNARGDFSLPILLNHLSPGAQSKLNPRVIADLFGTDGARALADLRALSGAKLAGMSERNTSNTGHPLARATSGMKTALLSALGFSTGGITGAVAVPVAAKFMGNLGEERAARLLTNPDVTKWLRNMPQATNPRAINAYFGRLESMAARTPGMLVDVKALQRSLIEAFAESPVRAAASPQQEGDSRRIPPAQ